jgi:ribosome-binding factor A
MLSNKEKKVGGPIPKGNQIKGPSQRQLRVAEEFRHLLSTIFTKGELSNLELANWTITITRVVMSPDLKAAKVYIIPLGTNLEPEQMKGFVKLLNESAPECRHLLSQRTNLRYAPTLKFYNDDTFEQAQRIDDLLTKVRQREKVKLADQEEHEG